MSVVRLIVATRSSGPPASGKIIKEMPGSVASGTTYISFLMSVRLCLAVCPSVRMEKLGSHLKKFSIKSDS